MLFIIKSSMLFLLITIILSNDYKCNRVDEPNRSVLGVRDLVGVS